MRMMVSALAPKWLRSPARNPRRRLTALILISVFCGGEALAANTMAGNALKNGVAMAGSTDRTAGQSGGSIAPNPSDQIALQAAATACKSQDPKAFFDAFIQSRAVQKKYSARSIEYVLLRPDFTVNSWEEIKADEYTVFPIIMVDYYRKSAQPLRDGVDEHVIIELNQGQNEAFVVEWTRVTFDGNSSGGDDLGAAFTLDGKPYRPGGLATDGQLLFKATPDCWQLTTDTRHFRGGSPK